MGKPTGKKKQAHETSKQGDAPSKPNKPPSSKSFDEDTAVFISMSQELKEEGNKLFQKRDHEGAMLKYEKALKLLPKTHIDVASLRTNMASCYMQMGIGEYPRAVSECNLALEVAPKYSKALLKRAKCFESLDRLDLAWKDVSLVLSMEPNNLTALDIRDSLKKHMEEKGIKVEEAERDNTASSEYDVVTSTTPKTHKQAKAKNLVKENSKSKENSNSKKKKKLKKDIGGAEGSERALEEDFTLDKLNHEDKEVVQEKVSIKEEKMVTMSVKLVLGDDIRWAQIPCNSSMVLVRDIVLDRYPNLKGVLVKYKDQEGDLITITTTEELRKAETSGDSEGCLRLYIAEVSPEQEPGYDTPDSKAVVLKPENGVSDDSRMKTKRADGQLKGEEASTCVDIWILQFAQLFKNHVGFDSDSYLSLHDVGMKLYSEAMEETVASEDAQELFNIASGQFQEMAALAMFNWGNVHMCKARKRVGVSEDHHSNESVLEAMNNAYERAKVEYMNAALRYQEAIKIKSDFYEGYLALGLQQFEQAKLCWSYSVSRKVESEEKVSSEVLQLYNKAEDCMESGMQLWEEMEERRLNGISKEDNYRPLLQKMGLDTLMRDNASSDEASEQATIMRGQIYIMWGSLLYERSVVEFKLGLLSWEECLEVAVEKFELAGASQTDIAVMIKNHCAHQTAQEGLGFMIDEIVQAWHDMYDAKRWLLGVPSFRLEPLFRRRVPLLQQIMERHV